MIKVTDLYGEVAIVNSDEIKKVFENNGNTRINFYNQTFQMCQESVSEIEHLTKLPSILDLNGRKELIRQSDVIRIADIGDMRKIYLQDRSYIESLSDMDYLDEVLI